MPANLTPQYHKAEAEYRRASTAEDELRCLELMLREVPKHKGTDKLQAELKTKISRAKADAEKARQAGKKTGHGGIKLPRQGAGRVVLIGGPNAGKSQLLKSLTRATPEVAPYPFTTRDPQPGMMPWEDVLVQLIDTPPISADVLDHHLLELIRGADLVLFIIDLGHDDGLEAAQAVVKQLQDTKTRLAKDSYLDEADIGVSYTKTLVVFNKVDLPGCEDRFTLLSEFCPLDFVSYRISAEHGAGLEDLRSAIYAHLDVVRVYTKLPTSKQADFEKPFTLRCGGTLLDVAELVHRDLAANFKHARVWGKQVVAGATQKGDYIVHDQDIVEIHTG